MFSFVNIASTSWLINSNSCIDIWAWCVTLSCKGSSWKSIFNPETHSNIFELFFSILKFSKKYHSLPENWKIPIFPFGKRFSSKRCTSFNWWIGTISGKCVFGRGEAMLKKISFFVEETLTEWSFWLPRWLRPLTWLRWGCWLTSTELQHCEWYKSPLFCFLMRDSLLFTRIFRYISLDSFFAIAVTTMCFQNYLPKVLGILLEKRSLVFQSVLVPHFFFSHSCQYIHTSAVGHKIECLSN